MVRWSVVDVDEMSDIEIDELSDDDHVICAYFGGGSGIMTC